MSIIIPKPPNNCNSIAAKLLSISFMIYFFIAIFLIIIQVNHEFNHEKKQLLNELDQFQQILSPIISSTFINNHNQQFHQIIEKTFNQYLLKGLTLELDNKNYLSIGKITTEISFNTPYLFNPFNKNRLFYKEYQINEHFKFKLFSSDEIVFNRIKYHIASTIINIFISAVILWFILYIVIKRLLSYPLLLLEKATTTLDINHLKDIDLSTDTFQALEIQRIEKSFNEMIKKLSKQININQRVENTFEKFVPKQFLQRIAQDGIENIQLGSNKASIEIISVLFSDIHQFTNLTEQMTPQEVLNFLNSYLARVSIPIQEYSGFIDKFLGDGIMALFDRTNQSATDSVKSAIAMIKMVEIYNQDRHKVNYEPITIGIGIHTGKVIIGTIGSSNRMESTVLGDVVNLSSRIQHLTKYYDTSIIITSETFEKLHDNSIICRELDFINVKGKKEPTSIFEVFNCDDEERKAKKHKLLNPYYEGLRNYYTQDWDRALSFFEICIDILEDDLISRMYIDRCHQYKKYPPPVDWDGALRFNLKH